MTSGFARYPLLCRAVPLLVSGFVLIIHAQQFNFITDDAYVSLVYARNLAEHGLLVFNVGYPPVEGYTNFLWTVLLAALHVARVPLEASALLLGLVFALSTLVVVLRLSARLRGLPSHYDQLAPMLLALSAGFACWSSGGLETMLFTFLVTVAIALAADTPRRGGKRLALVLALAIITRPEGLLLTAVVVAHQIWTRSRSPKRPFTRDDAVAATVLVGLCVPWFFWRWSYYGWPMPNTAYVKAAGAAAPGYELAMWRHGVAYVDLWLRESGVVFAAPLIAVGLLTGPRRSARRRFATLVAAFSALYLLYTIKIGGDFLGLHRFLMPLMPIAAVGCGFGVERLTVWLCRRRKHPTALTAVVVAAALIAVFQYQRAITRRATGPGNQGGLQGVDSPGFLAKYAHDRTVIGRALAPCRLPGDFAIYGGAGAQPFYSRIRGVDIFGLVSDRIAHEVPRTVRVPGHNKLAPNSLLFEYDPTFVFSCYDIQKVPFAPRLRCDLPWWIERGYEPVTMWIPGLVERGEFYTFLVKRSRRFECKGLLPPAR